MHYITPVRDMQFTLEHMAGFQAVRKSGAFEDLSGDLVASVLGEAGKYCDDVLAPLDGEADRNGAVLENGSVRVTPGFHDAYRHYVAGGWNGLAFPHDIGGQGLPLTLGVALTEALNGACMSFAVGLMLTAGAVKALAYAGTDRQKRIYLPGLVSGRCTGTMNLTEPGAGSDLSGIATKAVPAGNGLYRISGQKIYITYGDHDLTGNIVHLVLARLPDAPAGTAGISMFVVPRLRIGEDGSAGEDNDVSCAGLEHKLGLHGSPTCVMAFGERGECYGELLGQENRGLATMFVMMNSARLDVGMQATGVADAACQRAFSYALERRQGRGPASCPEEVRTADGRVPVYEHPDVRRMLYSMKSLTAAARAICYANAVAADLARTAPDDATAREQASLEALLTPVSKAWASDRANEITSMGVQVHGGMGYIEETGVARYMRDVRVAAIYEGTNGIQAIDLVERKIRGDGGVTVRAYIRKIRQECEIACATGNEDIRHAGKCLLRAVGAFENCTDRILELPADRKEDVLAAAVPYLRLFGNVAGGFYLVRGAVAAALAMHESGESTEYYRGKIVLARFFADTYLAEADGLVPCIMSGADCVVRLDPGKAGFL